MLPSEQSRFHLYLLLGQSNMAGRGPLPEPRRPAHPRVLTLDASNRWVPAIEPLHEDVAPAQRGVGPGLSFAEACAEANPSFVIGLVPCAVGGSALAQWMPGSELYSRAVYRMRNAMKRGELRGILWHQGESDAKAEGDARTYATRFCAMIESLRRELGVADAPVVVGEIGGFLAESGRHPWFAEVNNQITKIPALIEHAAWVSARGLADKGDRVHFDTAAQNELGRRYFSAMWELHAIRFPGVDAELLGNPVR